MSTRQGLLSGITVADFGWAVAGPVLTRFLAYHGATVMKIESNVRMDATRMSPPFAFGRPSRNRSGYFDSHNAGKKSIMLNLRHPEGRVIARRLAIWADVVNENFAPGVLDAFDLGYRALSAQRPDLVMVSSSMQGQTGPYARHPGLGQTLQGLVGISHLTGWPDREPVVTGQPYTDTVSPWIAGVALLAVLDHRRRTGEGAWIDLSQFEVAAHFLAPALVHEQLTGVRHVRRGDASLVRAPEGVYRCSGDDRWCAITVETDAQWEVLAEIIGFESPPGWPQQPDSTFRLAHAPELDDRIAAWTVSRQPREVQERLQAAGIAAYEVLNSQGLAEDPQLAARGHFVERDHPQMGPHLYEMPPFRLDEHPLRIERSPLIGEHTNEVLGECLGMSPAEIERAQEINAIA
jgi:benzylsuccinate CoA-transferase BbsF subunit